MRQDEQDSRLGAGAVKRSDWGRADGADRDKLGCWVLHVQQCDAICGGDGGAVTGSGVIMT